MPSIKAIGDKIAKQIEQSRISVNPIRQAKLKNKLSKEQSKKQL